MALAPDGHFFAELLIALEDNTPFYIGGKTIHLRKGEFCLFKGDVVHAGESFEKENYRFHCKLTFPTVQSPLPTNKDSVDHFAQYKCMFCDQRFLKKDKEAIISICATKIRRVLDVKLNFMKNAR